MSVQGWVTSRPLEVETKGSRFGWVALVGGCATLGALIAGPLLVRSQDERAGRVPSAGPVAGGEVEYPETWKRTLEEAWAEATFPLVLPDHPAANVSNLKAVYLWPNGRAVALRFPPPSAPLRPTRQAFIEIWESPWTGGDPEAEMVADLGAAPDVGKRLYEIDGVPALGVSAHSPSDVEGADPAFLWFVHDGIELKVAGGEDLDLLLEIARTIVSPASRDV